MEDNRFRLKVFLAVFFLIIALGTLGFEIVEGLSLTDAIYFSLVISSVLLFLVWCAAAF